MSKDYDWTRFRRKVFLGSDARTVYDAWTKSGKIIEWFIAEARYTTADGRVREPDEPVQAGDSYYWRWHQDAQIEGEVLEVGDGKLFKFSFGHQQNRPQEQHIVAVEIDEKDGEIELTLTQENMADEVGERSGWHLSCNLGWSFFMTNLKAWLEHGIDLREHDADRAYQSRAITL